MVHSLSVSLWEYHSNMTCNVMKHLMGYLLCISMDNYLLVWVSESWLKFRNAEALDVGLYPDEGYLIFIRKVDKHCKKFHFEGDCFIVFFIVFLNSDKMSTLSELCKNLWHLQSGTKKLAP